MCADIVPGKAQAGGRLPAAAFKAGVESRAQGGALGRPTDVVAWPRSDIKARFFSLAFRCQGGPTLRQLSVTSRKERVDFAKAIEKPFVRSRITAFVSTRLSQNGRKIGNDFPRPRGRLDPIWTLWQGARGTARERSNTQNQLFSTMRKAAERSKSA